MFALIAKDIYQQPLKLKMKLCRYHFLGNISTHVQSLHEIE